MVLSLAAGVLGLVVVTAPKTTGAYVPARMADCLSSGACAQDAAFVTSARFTEGKLEANWIMESQTVPWRASKAGPEVSDSSRSSWRPLQWEELPDGTVRTDAMLRGETELLRWIPEPLELIARRWSDAWTQAQLSRLAGTWGTGKVALTVGPQGIQRQGRWTALVARPCIEQCEGSVRLVCLEEPKGQRWWVVRTNGLQAASHAGLCEADGATVGAFEPGGKTLARTSGSAAASPPPTSQGISVELITRTVEQRVASRACHQAKEPLKASIALTVSPSGLPTKLAVGGVPEEIRQCVERLLRPLALMPASLGAPETAVKMTVLLAGP